MLRNLVRERGGDDRLHRHRMLRHGSLLDAPCADVVQKEDAHLISRDKLVGAVRTLHRDADAVRIGIRREHKIRFHLFREGKASFQSLENLRIRIRAGREIAVRIFLLGNNRHVVDPDVLQDPHDGHEAGAV